ncbi:hypothetical protein [Halorientalis litorea]|jgi:hypothetical protein|uniref:hypothetical protein n=1 Tax=Halorientalis litorea TaxID=2931977 RepID=UPI001FF0E169|nr:hypothetical protein [Halorientalis litorea]
MGRVKLFTTNEYEGQTFDAVLVRERAAVCVERADEADRHDDEGTLVRIVPLDKVNHVDGDAETLLVDTEIPESFYGGGEYGFVDTAKFPEIESHLEELADETY